MKKIISLGFIILNVLLLPAQHLSVEGNIDVGNRLNVEQSVNTPRLSLRNDQGTLRGSFFVDGDSAWLYAIPGKLFLTPGSVTNAGTYIAKNTGITLQAVPVNGGTSTVGRVGLGITEPRARLDVIGKSIFQDENRLLTLRSTGDNAFFSFEYRGGFSGANIGYFYDVGEPYYYIDMPGGLFGEMIILTDGRIFQNGSLIHSDRRLKSDIHPIQNSMATIQQLRGVSFRYKSPYSKGTKVASELTIGLIAQEVEEVLPQLVQERPDGYKAVNYTGLIPLLIEAAKDQQVEIRDQQRQISELTSEVNELRALVERLLAGQNQAPDPGSERAPKPQTRLSQNFPNPFHADTQIEYSLPESTGSARLDIHSVEGKLIESIPLSQAGNGTITIQAGRLPAGTYLYSLVTGEVVLDTKQMVLTK